MNLAILQARCSSTRLPGKVLKPLLGTPMILRQLERIYRCETLDRVVVATSVHPSDDDLVDVLLKNGVEVRRGSLDDVLSRFLEIAEELAPDSIVRLTGDNPLTDPQVIDAVVRSHVASGADYSSNSRVRTFPYGLDVECMRTGALLALQQFDLRSDEKEHVTPGIYNRPQLFDINSVTQTTNHSDLRWSVDYPEDLAFVEAVYQALYESNPAFNQADVVSLIGRNPKLRRRVTDVPV